MNLEELKSYRAISTSRTECPQSGVERLPWEEAPEPVAGPGSMLPLGSSHQVPARSQKDRGTAGIYRLPSLVSAGIIYGTSFPFFRLPRVMAEGTRQLSESLVNILQLSTS